MQINLRRGEQRWEYGNGTKREGAVSVHDAAVFACPSYSSTPRDRTKMDSRQLIFINGLYIQRVTKWAKTYPLIGQSVVFPSPWFLDCSVVFFDLPVFVSSGKVVSGMGWQSMSVAVSGTCKLFPHCCLFAECLRRTSSIRSPYCSSFFSPMPDTRSSSSGVDGVLLARSRRVASPKIM